jgi:hypothetical protein
VNTRRYRVCHSGEEVENKKKKGGSYKGEINAKRAKIKTKNAQKN